MQTWSIWHKKTKRRGIIEYQDGIYTVILKTRSSYSFGLVKPMKTLRQVNRWLKTRGWTVYQGEPNLDIMSRMNLS